MGYKIALIKINKRYRFPIGDTYALLAVIFQRENCEFSMIDFTSSFLDDLALYNPNLVIVHLARDYSEITEITTGIKNNTKTSHIPILGFSDNFYDYNEIQNSGLDLGYDDIYLGFPLDRLELMEKIKDLIERSNS